MLPKKRGAFWTQCRRDVLNLCLRPNMIESFFSKMTKQMLRGIRVNTKQELAERIYKYFDEANREPVVYHWKYKMDEINEIEAASV